MNALIYDCEIVNCIPDKSENKSDLTYCQGWTDFGAMGISVIAAYDYRQNRYRVFLEDNFAEFADLVKSREHVIGFNSVAFDDRLCAANGIEVKTTYDLLRQVRRAAGEPEEWTRGVSSSGLSLENLAQANLGYGKTGSGAHAPELWQRGEKGQVIDYCLQDVHITRQLLELGTRRGLVSLNAPKVWRLAPCTTVAPVGV